jgi:tRNA threonylcarbamoyladenosine biosynthesis protein TsaE
MHGAMNTPPEATVRRLPDPAATEALGAELAALARPGDTICLIGDLGAGKTALARGFIHARLGAVEVTSPTFTLMQLYGSGEDEIWHVDLYRIEETGELRELGLEEAMEETICLIEWPERLGALLPPDRLEVRLAFDGTGGRTATLVAFGAWEGRV